MPEHTAETHHPEPTFADNIWPEIKADIDASMFNLDTSKAGIEHALKLAADIAVDRWKKQVASPENRDALAQALGARAFDYDTDHNEDEWAECVELADVAFRVMLGAAGSEGL